MPFYIFAWIGAFTSGLTVITAKLTSKHSISNPWVFTVAIGIVTLLFTAPVALLNNAGMPVDWLPLILAGLFSTLFNVTWVLSTYALDVSVLSPLFNFRGVFAVLIGALFLHEDLQPVQFIFVGLIIIAGVFASIDEKLSLKSFLTKNIAIGILCTLLLAIFNTFVNLSQVKNSLWTTNLWIAILGLVFSLPIIPYIFKDLKQVKAKQLLPIGAMGVFSIITDFSANAAYAVNVGITSLIMNTPFSMLIAFALSFFAPSLLEKHPLKIYAIRFAATAVMIFCAIQLTQ